MHCKFQNTTSVLVPSDQKFIKICDAFQHLRQKVPHYIPIPLNKDILIKVTEIASFLNISESNL